VDNLCAYEVDSTTSGSCPVADFAIRGVDISDSSIIIRWR